MSKICSKCGHTMYYDPYFEKLVCRGCGHTEFEKIRPKPLEEVNSSQYDYKKMREYVSKLES